MAIWASAGLQDEAGNVYNRCVIIDDYTNWVPIWEKAFGYTPIRLWRRFR